MSKGWSVVVINYATGEHVQKISAANEGQANRIQGGLDINLNHDKFYTRVIEESEAEHELSQAPRP